MNPAWIDKASRLPPRQLHLLGAGLLLVAGAALWFYALRAPLAGLRTQRAEQARLEAAGPEPARLAAQLARVEAESAALAARLGHAQAGPAAQRQLALIGAIGKLAAAHGVALTGASPAPEQPVMVFAQSGFDAQASGRYAALLAWMGAIEHAGPDLSIAGFEMGAAKAPGQVDMKLRVAAYRTQEDSP
jgi:Tfp pilus assembly protein PilO